MKTMKMQTTYCYLLSFSIFVLATLCGGTELWLNEIDVEGRRNETDVIVGLEVVGRPKGYSPSPPAALEVRVNFYSLDGMAGVEDVITLVPRGDLWNGSYVGTLLWDDSRWAAFPQDRTQGGLRLDYEDELGPISKVYCWGDSHVRQVGPAEDKQDCQIFVADQLNMPYHTQHETYGLRHKTSEGQPGDKEEDFVWLRQVEVQSQACFPTLNIVNICDKWRDCSALWFNQTIAEYRYTSPPGNSIESKVWVNEIYVEGPEAVHEIYAEGVDEVFVSLEVVGRPDATGTPPTTVDATARFYNEDGAVGDDIPMSLSQESGAGQWRGNYVGTLRKMSGLGAAFPNGDQLAGLKVSYLGTDSIYCWGTNASTDSEIGGVGSGLRCESVVKTGGPMKGSGEAKASRALFNKGHTPAEGGSMAKDFHWTDAKFDAVLTESIGSVNGCQESPECPPTMVQVVARYDGEVSETPPPTESVSPTETIPATIPPTTPTETIPATIPPTTPTEAVLTTTASPELPWRTMGPMRPMRPSGLFSSTTTPPDAETRTAAPAASAAQGTHATLLSGLLVALTTLVMLC